MSNAERPAYRAVLASNRVEGELDSLSTPDYRRVVSALRNLERNPRTRGSVRLQGDIYRVRVGPYRIIYMIDESEMRIILGAIRRRTETTYRDIERLF